LQSVPHQQRQRDTIPDAFAWITMFQQCNRASDVYGLPRRVCAAYKTDVEDARHGSCCLQACGQLRACGRTTRH